MATRSMEQLKTSVSDRIKNLSREGRVAYLKRIVPLLDLTNLTSSATSSKIRELCKAARRYKTAAVCINPIYVKTARECLPKGGVKIASVAGGFPLSQTPIEIKEAEIHRAREDGADELDVVLNQGAFLSGDIPAVAAELRRMRAAAGTQTLKVILETCELQTPENIQLASRMAIAEGADFIKTSTGFGKHGATFEHVAIMLGVIAEESRLANGRKIVGMKPAGGVKTPDEALALMFLADEIVGSNWLTSELFRFGASSLLTAVSFELEQLIGYNPYTGEHTASLIGLPGPSFTMAFPELFPYVLPNGATAALMARELGRHVSAARANRDPGTRVNEMLRVARFLSAETGFNLGDSMKLLHQFSGSRRAEADVMKAALNLHTKEYDTPEGRRALLWG